MINKKSQSAMEYLMTYGWAILVVLIALGALFYLGVFSPKTPNTCTAVAPFTCIDTKVVTGLAGDQMVIGASGVSGTPTFAGFVGTCTGAAWAGAFINGQNTVTLTCPDALARGSQFSGSFDMAYTAIGGGLSHTIKV